MTLPARDEMVVAPGFEPVLDAFAAGASDLGEGGGAYAVYRDGELVVDLWAGTARAGEPWQRDTLATLMSTTKGLTAGVAQLLHSRGLLDVEAPVATCWPEFAQSGKERATVRMVLDHSIGVLGLPAPEALLGWDGTGWDDLDAIASALAASEPAWEPGTKIGYHAISYGWLVNEIVRRITGRTVGDVFASEIAKPLGLDAWIGTPPDVEPRVATIIPETTEGLPPDIAAVDAILRAGFNEPGSLLATAAISVGGSCIIDNLGGFMNLPHVRGLEIAAANGSAGARDLARFYSAQAQGGEGVFTPESIALFSEVSAKGRSAVTPAMLLPDGTIVPEPWTCYALGYARNLPEPGMPPPFGPHVETFGHAGHGGQLGFCDPVSGLGIGFVRSALTLSPVFAATLLQTTYACL